MKKRRNNPGRKPLRPRPKPTSKAVEAFAAAGRSEDWIALHYGLHKNVLRARFADVLDGGRELERAAAAAAEAEAAAQTKNDAILLKAIKGSFESHWFDPELGNLLFHGAHTIEQAIKGCQEYGHFQGLTAGKKLPPAFEEK